MDPMAMMAALPKAGASKKRKGRKHGKSRKRKTTRHKGRKSTRSKKK